MRISSINSRELLKQKRSRGYSLKIIITPKRAIYTWYTYTIYNQMLNRRKTNLGRKDLSI